MTDFALRMAQAKPTEAALQDPRSTIDWMGIYETLNRLSNGLQEFSLGDDRRIAVFAENSIETALANLGGLVAGASVVPVNFHLTATEVAYILTPVRECCLRALKPLKGRLKPLQCLAWRGSSPGVVSKEMPLIGRLG